MRDIMLVVREAQDKQEKAGNKEWFHELRWMRTIPIMIAVLWWNRKKPLEPHAEAREKTEKLAHRQLGWKETIRMIAGQS
jgi:malonyl CoA-acyl carrier protein transacylase